MNPYGFFIHVKNWLYDRQFLKSDDFGAAKIISVGNLNTGGSGKTPFIIFLTELILRQKPQARICVVTKSYKARLKTPAQVDLSSREAIEIYGDEACLLQTCLPKVVVWSGPSKSKTVQALMQNQDHFDYILVDDGFSHRQLKRHCEITLIDTSRDPAHYRLLPLGRMREDWSALKRSDLIVYTKTQHMPIHHKMFFNQKTAPYQKPIIESSYQIQLKIPACPVILITGLGNPQAVRDDLFANGYTVMKEFCYPDHYDFPEKEQVRILNWAQEHAEWTPVMTEKDFIKITVPDLKKMIQVISLQVTVPEEDLKYFYEKVL